MGEERRRSCGERVIKVEINGEKGWRRWGEERKKKG